MRIKAKKKFFLKMKGPYNRETGLHDKVLEEVTPQAYLLNYCDHSYKTVRYGYVGSYSSGSLDLGGGRFLNCQGTSSSGNGNHLKRQGDYTLSITESPLFQLIV
jgi:hypothetical protein